MLYDITLTISYSFAPHAASGHQILRVMPKDIADVQRVIVANLDFKPRASTRRDGRDFFGNTTVEASYQHVRGELSFTLQARVKRNARAPQPDLSPALTDLPDDLAACTTLGPASPHHFRNFSQRITRDPAIEAYARQLALPHMSVLHNVVAISNALYRDIRFDAEATDVKTPASVAFAHKKGVCQDFTHIMITALRSIGIPAGYVSGFLRTIPPEGAERLEGADAMHAWVMAWCGRDAGWVEIDPTNGMMVGTDHVVIAMGRDYNDVSPVTGILKTAGVQKTEQAVDVVAVPE